MVSYWRFLVGQCRSRDLINILENSLCHPPVGWVEGGKTRVLLFSKKWRKWEDPKQGIEVEEKLRWEALDFWLVDVGVGVSRFQAWGLHGQIAGQQKTQKKLVRSGLEALWVLELDSCPSYWGDSVGWVPAREPKSHQFDSQSGYIPGLQAR